MVIGGWTTVHRNRSRVTGGRHTWDSGYSFAISSDGIDGGRFSGLGLGKC